MSSAASIAAWISRRASPPPPSRRSWTAGPSSCARSPRPPCASPAARCARGAVLELLGELGLRHLAPRAAAARGMWSRSFASSVRADASASAARRRPSPRRRAACAAPPPRVGGRRLEEPAAPGADRALHRAASLALLHSTHRHLQPLLRVDQVLDACAASARRGCWRAAPAPARARRMRRWTSWISSVPEGGVRRDHRVLRHRAPGWLTPRNCLRRRICGPFAMVRRSRRRSAPHPATTHSARRRSFGLPRSAAAPRCSAPAPLRRQEILR